jgi:hypothetical protein
VVVTWAGSPGPGNGGRLTSVESYCKSNKNPSTVVPSVAIATVTVWAVLIVAVVLLALIVTAPAGSAKAALRPSKTPAVIALIFMGITPLF